MVGRWLMNLGVFVLVLVVLKFFFGWNSSLAGTSRSSEASSSRSSSRYSSPGSIAAEESLAIGRRREDRHPEGDEVRAHATTTVLALTNS